MSVLEIIGLIAVVCVCIDAVIIVIRFCDGRHMEQNDTYVYYGEIECIINDADELDEKERDFKKRHPDLRGGICSYNCNGRKHILSYRIMSQQPIKPSDIVDYEGMYTDGSITVDFRKLRNSKTDLTFLK